uniref:Uncharacterized protein n=1 Tax=Oryza barthii TaxID=65489 RepID=A0A0D3HV36_9ORYZ
MYPATQRRLRRLRSGRMRWWWFFPRPFTALVSPMMRHGFGPPGPQNLQGHFYLPAKVTVQMCSSITLLPQVDMYHVFLYGLEKACFSHGAPVDV